MPWTQIATLKGADGVEALTDANINAAATTLTAFRGRVDPGAAGADGTLLGWQAGMPFALPGAHWDARWSGAVVYSDLTTHANMTDSAAAWNAAVAKAKALGVPLVAGSGRYRADSLVTIDHHADLTGVTFVASSLTLDPLVKLGHDTEYRKNLRIVAPSLRNEQASWTGNTSRGFKVINLDRSKVWFQAIDNWGEGILFTSSPAKGLAYNHFEFESFTDCKVGWHTLPGNGFGWCNQNYFGPASFSHSTNRGLQPGNLPVAGVRHIWMEEKRDAPSITGTATSANATTLTDTTKALTTNQYQNYILEITGGTGAGQRRVISSHTATVFTTAGMIWETTPDATSTYSVYKSSNTNNNTVMQPSLEGNASEVHMHIEGRENLFIAARNETHTPSTVRSKVNFVGPLAQYNKVDRGFGSGGSTDYMELEGANGNDFDTPLWKLMSGGPKGTLILRNASSNNTGVIYVVPTSYRVQDNAVLLHTIKIASNQVDFKATTDTQPKIRVNTSSGVIELGNGTDALDISIRRISGVAEGVVTAPRGSMCISTNGNWYRKATGTENTGWVAIT